MPYAIAVCLAAAGLFLAFLLSLALRPKVLRTLMGWSMLFSSVTALLLYGLGYGWSARTPGEAAVAVLRAANGALWLFGGRENLSELCAGAPWLADSPALQILFWTAYLCAVYVTASAVLNALGQRMLRRLRQFLLPFYRVCMFYGEGDEPAGLAGQLPKGLRPLFVCPGSAAGFESQADKGGGVLWPEDRIDGNGLWLKRLGIRPGGRKRLEMVCLHPDDGRSLSFLTRVTAGLRAQGIGAEQVHIAVVSEWEFTALADLKLGNGQYLALDAFTRGELAARRLVAEAPPWRTMDFDENGCARGDFSILVIGFGGVGQSVLRCLIQNSQFVGSRFSAAVVDQSPADGAFMALYGDMMDRYHVEICPAKADSKAFVDLLDQMAPSLRYVVVCAGTEKANREIVAELRRLRARAPGKFQPSAVLARCGREGVTLCGWSGGDRSFPSVELGDLLAGRLDREAKSVNDAYLAVTARRLWPTDQRARRRFYRRSWYETDLLSRLSCRASASFRGAFYAAAGVDAGAPDAREQMRRRLARPELLENLSRMEHLRWNAFYASMGVRQMAPEEFARRAEAARSAIDGRIGALMELDRQSEAPLEEAERETLLARTEAMGRELKDAAARVRKDVPADGIGGVHACLADWDALTPLWESYRELDALLGRVDFLTARVRYRLTGEGEEPQMPVSRCFQQLDTDTVLSMLEEGGGM